MKKIFAVFLAFMIAVAVLTACSPKSTNSYEDHSGSAPVPAVSPPPSGSSTDTVTLPPVSSTFIIDNGQVAAGQLTAAEWNDNNHFDQWLDHLSQNQENLPGIFIQYLEQWDLNTQNRVVVQVQKEETPVSGATVQILKEDVLCYTAVTDAKGNAYLFLKDVQENDSLTVQVSSGSGNANQEITYTKGMDEVEITLNEATEKLDKLEIMFVVDTTGSMSDELLYLQSEIKDVITVIKQDNPDTDISVALLFYRDVGDTYVTRYFDFNADIDAVKADISAQTADGGGDFPEAVHTALSEAVAKQWSTGSTTKLLFHVMDAPPHDEDQIMDTYISSIETASQKGIRMVPVASSGIDRATEYLLRNEALLTGGTYVFLTNESGIGNSHLDPSIEGYVVEYLNDLLVRIINEFHTGIHVPPTPYSQPTS